MKTVLRKLAVSLGVAALAASAYGQQINLPTQTKGLLPAANGGATGTVNPQTGTTYTYLTGDRGKLVTHSNAGVIAATLPQANATTFRAGWVVDVQDIGAGTLTITPTTSTINGAATLVLITGQGAHIVSDGTNYSAQLGKGGSGSNFTGSTASSSSFSATPTFSLADVSVKSPTRFEPAALTANVTAVTFTNKSAGAKFSIAWLQDGTGSRTVAYGASASNPCSLLPTAGSTTTQNFEVAADGTTVVGTGCSASGAPADLLFCIDGSSSGRTCTYGPASGGGNLTLPVGSDTLAGKATTDTFTNKTIDSAGTGNHIKIAGTDVTALSGTGSTLCTSVGSACAAASANVFDFTSILLHDSFCAGYFRTDALGQIGELGWSASILAASAPTVAMSNIASWPCSAEISTAATNGEGALFAMQGGIPKWAFGASAAPWETRMAVQLTSVASVRVAPLSFGSECVGGTANCISVFLDTALGATFTFEACNATPTCTSVNSSITPSANTTYTIRIWSTVSGTINASVNSETALVISTNAPSAAMQLRSSIRALTNAVKTIRYLGFGFQMTGLTP